ncbi:MAG: glutamine--fructose-6-phosphate transaminase (isomerizing) [Oligoflexales bacterium]
MCGIIGFAGQRPGLDILFDGLQRLEYRGYDSSGIAVSHNDHIDLVKSEGKLAQLKPLLHKLPEQATIGMGHTRWATHGPPTTRNAHPHRNEGITIVHNGILENYQQLKIELLEEGVTFASDTDSEVIVHLLEKAIKDTQNVKTAIQTVLEKLKGAWALGVLSSHEPDAIYLVKQGSPLVVGLGSDENFFASDTMAMMEHTNQFLFLEDGEMARIRHDGVNLWDFHGTERPLKPVKLDHSATAYGKNGYPHFMKKEIHEQPGVIANTVQRHLKGDDVNLQSLGLSDINIHNIRSIHIVGCGTAHISSMLGRYALETWAHLPVQVELASEFRSREPYLDPQTLIIAVTQSGETADTLACVQIARQAGCQVLAICNVQHSSIPRLSTSTLYMEAGPEIGVASTKAFSAMVLSFYFLALAIGKIKNIASQEKLLRATSQLRTLPLKIEQAINTDREIEKLSAHYTSVNSCLFIGRHFSYPVALEGALKLKELSYIHAEGYAGGELKHGPIALIDRDMPIIAVAPLCDHYEKTLANLEEIKARDGKILGFGAEGESRLASLCENTIACPQTEDPCLQAILSVIPLQLFSYYVALRRETDVDQPRNLAKSVTVE